MGPPVSASLHHARASPVRLGVPPARLHLSGSQLGYRLPSDCRDLTRECQSRASGNCLVLLAPIVRLSGGPDASGVRWDTSSVLVFPTC